MTQQQWTVSQELTGVLVILDEAQTAATASDAAPLIDKARGAIERTLSLIQRLRCGAVAELDKL